MALRAAILQPASPSRVGRLHVTRRRRSSACRKAAKRLKVKVVAELVEAPSTSGYRNRGRSRPKFQELLELIRTGAGRLRDRLQDRPALPRRWTGLGAARRRVDETAGRDPDTTRSATAEGWVSEFEIGIRLGHGPRGVQEDIGPDARRSSTRGEGRHPHASPAGRRTATPRLQRDRRRGGRAHRRGCRPGARGRIGVGHLHRLERARKLASVTGRPWTVQTLTSILRSGRIASLHKHRGVVVSKGRWPAMVEPRGARAVGDRPGSEA